MFESRKMRGVVFLAAALGLLLSAGIHIAGLFAIEMGTWPFLLHIFAILALGASLLLYTLNFKEIPPEHRASAFSYFLSVRPKWLVALVVFLFIYAVGNFFVFAAASASGVSRFSGHWLLFFAAAMLLAYPVRPLEAAPALRAPERLPDSFHVPYSDLFSRMMEGKVKYLFAWLAFLVLGFAVLSVVIAPQLFFVSVFFALGLSLNLVSWMFHKKILISEAAISGGVLTGEVYRFNTLERFQYPLSTLKTEFLERYARGTGYFVLKISDKDGRELITQFSSNQWHYAKLKQLYDRIQIG